MGRGERLRAHEVDDAYRVPTDALLPGLSTTVRPLEDLEADAGGRDVNLAIVTDVTAPEVASAPAEDDPSAASLSLYGLLARFVTSFANDARSAAACQRIPIALSSVHHPGTSARGLRRQ